MNGTWISLKSNQVPTTDAFFGGETREQRAQRVATQPKIHSDITKKYTAEAVRLTEESQEYKDFKDRAIFYHSSKQNLPAGEIDRCHNELNNIAKGILQHLIPKHKSRGLFRTGYRSKEKHSSQDIEDINRIAYAVAGKLTGDVYNELFHKEYVGFGQHG
jgi:hypothetical protein